MTLLDFYTQLFRLSIENNLNKKFYDENEVPIPNKDLIDMIERNPENYEYLECILEDNCMHIKLDIE